MRDGRVSELGVSQKVGSRSDVAGGPRWRTDAHTRSSGRCRPHCSLSRSARERSGRWSAAVVRVIVAEPSHFVRLGLIAVIDADEDLSVTAVVTDASELQDAFAEHEADVVLMDRTLHRQQGLELLDAIGAGPDRPVVVVADEVSDAELLEVFRRGAHGLVLLDAAPFVLSAAVRAVAAGGKFIDPHLAETLLTVATKGQPGSHGPFDLTVQQQRVLALLPDGLTNREIGEELGISPNTVKAHLRKAMAKIGAHDRIEAADIVTREGLD